MKDLLTPYRNQPLGSGWNPLIEDDSEIGIDFGIFVLDAGQSHSFETGTDEVALLVVTGTGKITAQGQETPFDRHSWIEQPPWAVHAPHGETVGIHAESRTEIAVVRTANEAEFPLHVYLPEEVENEHRGKGMLDDASYRIVRCVFDRRNAPENARLVLGEVVNFPGRWSSYPPHHHSQPELYYYRFEPEWGYGHGELGESVFKLRHHDLLRITGERDHAQTSAPGFHMYYLWTIRHLPGDPYTGFQYTPPFEELLK